MKILIVGGTGTIGQAVVKELAQRHELVIAGRQQGDVLVDITDQDSIKNMYQQIGKVDAVVSATGQTHFAPLLNFTAEKYQIGLQSKLMGQINLVHLGLNYMNDAGSFTLISGVLSHDPIREGASAAMVNGAINAFVRSAAIEMPKQIRINAISPTVITESLDKYADYFRGFVSVSVARVAQAFSKSVEGAQTGQIYSVD